MQKLMHKRQTAVMNNFNDKIKTVSWVDGGSVVGFS